MWSVNVRLLIPAWCHFTSLYPLLLSKLGSTGAMQLQTYEIQYFLLLCNATAVMLVKYHFKSTPSLYNVYHLYNTLQHLYIAQNILVLCNKGSVKYNVTQDIKVTLTFLQVFQFHPYSNINLPAFFTATSQTLFLKRHLTSMSYRPQPQITFTVNRHTVFCL